MSIIDSIMKKTQNLKEDNETLVVVKKLTEEVHRLTQQVVTLTNAVKSQEMTLAELYVVQVHLLGMLKSEIPVETDQKHRVASKNKSEKPN